MSSFDNKKVLVTGGAKGIGKLIGLKALREGAECLVVWDIDQEAMEELSRECEKERYKCHFYKVDLSKVGEIEETARRVLEEVGNIDMLFNNAGIVVGKKFINQSTEQIQKTLNINIQAVMLTTKAFLPAMVEQKSGHIINISSASSLMANPNMSVYTASKWAVTGWSESLRLELERSNSHVKITTIQPSYIDTGMFAGVKAPLLTPLLDPEVITDKIVRAVKKDKIILREPLMVKFTPFLRGILPTRVFDFIAGRIFKVYNSMNNFRGRNNNE